jgi:hypothetical protein
LDVCQELDLVVALGGSVQGKVATSPQLHLHPHAPLPIGLDRHAQEGSGTILVAGHPRELDDRTRRTHVGAALDGRAQALPVRPSRRAGRPLERRGAPVGVAARGHLEMAEASGLRRQIDAPPRPNSPVRNAPLKTSTFVKSVPQAQRAPRVRGTPVNIGFRALFWVAARLALSK